MTKTPANPKLNVMRGLTVKLAPVFRRSFAEMSRAQQAPATAARMLDELEALLGKILAEELGKSGQPVHDATKEWPAGESDAWVHQPLCGRRNAGYGRLPCSVQMGYLRAGKLACGAVYFPIEDLLVIAEPGTGASQGSGSTGGRMRVGGRSDLRDTLLLLPMSSIDSATYKLMEKADAMTFHTRKSGHPLFDAIDVASGRADAALLTNLTPLESSMAQLLLVEAGGVATAPDGSAATPTSPALLLSNLKLHPQYVAMLAASSASA